MVPRIDLTGQQFGRWTVLGPDTFKSGAMHWHCRCDCGTERIVNGAHLRNSKTTSCGCYKSEATSARNFTHGYTKHPLYRLWLQIIDRCENPKNAWFHRYGKRGISVCERWHHFPSFCEDVGERPEGMTLDRINNDGNYESSNVHWATRKQQAQNQEPRDRMITAFGKTRSVTEWAERLGVDPQVIHTRLNRGWAEAQAVLLPKGKRR